MGTDAIIVIVIIVMAVILFVWDKVPSDFVAIALMTGFVVTGVLTPTEALQGFSNPATITVAFMFVLSYALLKTGALQRFSPQIGDLFKKNYSMGMISLMLFVGISSAFINNTPVVAMFIPVIISISYRTGIKTSRLLIPLSYASILGGTCTLIGTSTNVLVAGIADSYGIEGFGIFTSTPIGVVYLMVGTLFLFLFGRKLLPNNTVAGSLKDVDREYVTEIKINSGSDLIGKSIMESIFLKELQLDVIEVKRGVSRFSVPQGDFVFQSDDQLRVSGNIQKIKELKDRLKVEIKQSEVSLIEKEIIGGNTTLLEIIITKGSEFEGKTLKQVDFRRRYRAVPLAILHRDTLIGDTLNDQELSAGDMVLIELKSHRMTAMKREEMQKNGPFIILSEEGLIDFDKQKFGWVIGVLALIVLSSALKLLPIVTAVSAGILLLILSRVIRMRDMYQSIEWRIVFLLAGAMSIGVAMEKTGLANSMAEQLVSVLLPMGPMFLLAGLYLMTSVCTELMSNTATAALFAPIAIGMAEKADVDPIPLLITVMLAASASFMTPIGYQTNTMVFSAGRYRFVDFLKIGVWLNLLLMILAVLLIPLIYPFN